MPNGRPRRPPPDLARHFPDAEPVGDGVYRAAGETAVLEVGEVLAAAGLPVTDENIAAVIRAAKAHGAEQGHPVEVIDETPPSRCQACHALYLRDSAALAAVKRIRESGRTLERRRADATAYIDARYQAAHLDHLAR